MAELITGLPTIMFPHAARALEKAMAEAHDGKVTITYPPELLPKPEGEAEVVVVNSDGSTRVVDETSVSDFPPEPPQKRIVSDS